MSQLISIIHKISNRIPVLGKYFTEEFIRFVFIGGTSFIIFYFLNNSFIFLLEKIYSSQTSTARGLVVWNAYIVAYLLAFIYNFTLSKRWTFRNQSVTYREQLLKFFTVNIFNALTGAAFVTILDYIGIPPYISQPFFIAIQIFWTYFLYKRWVFSD